MDCSDVDGWTKLGPVVSAAAAAIALFFTAYSMLRQTRAADAQSLLQIARDLREADLRFANAKDNNEEFIREFNNQVNLFEVLAAAVNGRLLGAKSTEITKHALIASLAAIEGSDTAKSLLERAVDTPNTFSELQKFIKKNRLKINSIAKIHIQNQ